MKDLPQAQLRTSKELLKELFLYLRPPGQGIYSISTGREEIEAQSARYLSEKTWRVGIEELASLKGKEAVAILALPSDTGCGILRGAARGPEAIRAAWKKPPCVDLGDVLVVPQLLTEDLVGDEAYGRISRALYGEEEARTWKYPVSPIGMAARVLTILRVLNPELRVFLLGGDHTVAWPAMDALFPVGQDYSDVGILHFDAHTDLLSERQGVEICFTTWAYHANVRIGRGKRLLQVGIRATRQTKEYWESQEDVKQIWGEEALELSAEDLADVCVEHFRSLGVKRVYISNDIDGTDQSFAAACGTPESGGLIPEQVVAAIQAMAEHFEIIGADLVEFAPHLAPTAAAREVALSTAALYATETIQALKRRV